MMQNILSATSTLSVDITIFVLLVLFTLAVSLVGIWIISATMHREAKTNGPITIFSVALVAGVVIRILLAIFIRGNRDAYASFVGSQSDVYHLMNYGADGLYENGVGTSPISLYIIFIFAKIASALGFATNSVGMQIFVKLPLIISDVITAIIIYKMLSKFSSKYVSASVAGLFILIPVTFIASAIWPTDISLVLPFITLALYFMSIKSYFGMFATYSAALLVSKDALYLFPVFAVFVVVTFVKSCKSIGRGTVKNIKDLWNDEEKSPVIKMPVYLVLCILVSYIVCLPLTVGAINANFFKWFSLVYLKPLVNISLYSDNGISIYNIFGRNGIGFNSKMAVWFVVIGAVIITLFVLTMYWGKRNRANLVAIAAFTLTTIYVYFVGFSAMDMLLIFPIILLAFVLIKDKRLLSLFVIFSFAFVLNSAGILAYQGAFNNLATLTPMAQKTFLTTINIIASVVTVLGHLYMIIVTLDISGGQRKLFNPVNTFSLKENLKNWLGR